MWDKDGSSTSVGQTCTHPLPTMPVLLPGCPWGRCEDVSTSGWVLRGAALVVPKQSGMTASGLVRRGGWASPDLALSVLGSFLLPQG